MATSTAGGPCVGSRRRSSWEGRAATASWAQVRKYRPPLVSRVTPRCDALKSPLRVSKGKEGKNDYEPIKEAKKKWTNRSGQ